MFTHGAPRFISPNPPPYETESLEALDAYSALPEPSTHQLSLFLSTVSPQLSTSNLRSFLRLYTTLGTDKLAGFLGVDEEEVLEMLMTAQGAARKFTWVEGGLLEGQVVGVSDINFGIDEVIFFSSPFWWNCGAKRLIPTQTHVTVAESKTSRRYGDFFLRHGLKFADVYANLHAKPLPIPKMRPNANGSAGAAPGVPSIMATQTPAPVSDAPKTVAWAA